MFKKIAITVAAALLVLGLGIHLHHFVMVHAQSSEPVAHKENSFDLVFAQPYDRVAPLFGANGERAWAGAEWNPKFLYPNPPQDAPGAIFSLEHGGHKQLWITPTFDLKSRHIQHLIVMPDVMVTEIDITFPGQDSDKTKVHVVYQRTALNPAFNDHVAGGSEHDAKAAVEWQQAIDSYFAASKHP